MDRTFELHALISELDTLFKPFEVATSLGPFEDSASKIVDTLRKCSHRALLRNNGGRNGQALVDADVEALNIFKTEISALSDEIQVGIGKGNDALELHRRNVVQYLWKELEAFSEVVRMKQQELLKEARERDNLFHTGVQKIHKPKLTRHAGVISMPSDSAVIRSNFETSKQPEFSSDQMTLLLNSMADKTDEMIEIKQKLNSLAEMMSFFTQQVVQQQEQCEQLLSVAGESTLIIDDADKELKSAVKRSSSYRFHQLCFYVGGAIALLVLDQIF